MTVKLPSWGVWSCYKGDGFARALTITANGAALNITSYTITFTAKVNADDADSAAVISKTATITNGAGGLASLVLDATDTNVAPGTYEADLELKPPSGGPTTIRGQFAVVQDVRRGT